MTTRAALAFVAVGLAWAALAFLSVALFNLLAPSAGVAGAAALTAAMLLAVLAVGVLAYVALNGRKGAQLQQSAPAPPPAKREPLLSASAEPLALLAKTHPFLAVGCAAVLGIADSIQAETRRD